MLLLKNIDKVLLTDFLTTTQSVIIEQKYGSVISCTLKYKDKKFKLFMLFWEQVNLNNLTMDDCFNYKEQISTEDSSETIINRSVLNSLIKYYNKCS
jgi:hypothetical protein